MKQKIKEMAMTYLLAFCIGGVLGFMHTLFSGIYSCYEGIMLTKVALITFFIGGVAFIALIAVIQIIGFVIGKVIKTIKNY